MSKGAQIAIGATAIALLIAWYGMTNLGDEATFQYYQTLDEMLAAGDAAENRALRIHGYVSNDSIERDLESMSVRFVVQNDPPHAGNSAGATLSVLYQSLETPDLFRDGAEVVVEGRIQGHGDEAVFQADNVMAKCPSKFEAQARAGSEGATPGEASL